MRRTLVSLVVAICVVGSLHAQTPAKQAPATTASAPTVDSALAAMRADLQTTRADLMAKNLSLTADQAAKFWPVFSAYQREQNVIMDDQLRDLQTYVKNFDTLDDASALSLMKANFDRDTRMNTLRQKWLAEFQKVLPTKLAVRAMQIDRSLSLIAQAELASRLPLVH